MFVDAYVILEPGADRPYFCHYLTKEYLDSRKPGSKVFAFRLDVPGFEKVEGVIQLEPTDVVELTERLMAPEHIEDKEFTCPKCSGHAFGSSELANGLLERMCNTPGCKFTFTEFDDDKYFKGTGHFIPATVTGTTGAP